MTKRREPFWEWPGWQHLRLFALLAVAQTIWFGLVFVGCNHLTATRSFRVRVHLDAELELPFVPEAVILYMSIYPLFWIAPFILRTREQLCALAVTLAAVTLIAGICFLLFPAELAFPVHHHLGRFPELFRLADRWNLDYNLMPSLHVALSVVCIAAYAGRTHTIGKMLLWSWAAAISASTLLSHQHHLLDVITGFLLAVGATNLIYRRLDATRKTGDQSRCAKVA